MKTSSLFLIGMGAALALAPLPAAAQSVRVLGDFRDWSAYAATESGEPLCFVMTKPVQTEPQPDGYSQAYLYLTHRPTESVRFEFNLVSGYTFAPDSPAIASVNGQNYTLFTQSDAAWLEDPAQAENLAGSIRAGANIVVEGTTERGIKVRQTFSLSGATAASNAISGECA